MYIRRVTSQTFKPKLLHSNYDCGSAKGMCAIMEAVLVICTKQALLIKLQSEWLIAGVFHLQIVVFECMEVF